MIIVEVMIVCCLLGCKCWCDGDDPNYCVGGNAVETDGGGCCDDNWMKMMVIVMNGCC